MTFSRISRLSSGEASSTKMNSTSCRVWFSNDSAQRSMKGATLKKGEMTETFIYAKIIKTRQYQLAGYNLRKVSGAMTSSRKGASSRKV